MAVYARGYRTYDGGFTGAPGWWTIFREAYGIAFRSKGFRMIGMLFIVWFVIWGALLYSTLGVDEATRSFGSGRNQVMKFLSPASQLKQSLTAFYGGISVLSGLLALLVGAGLVSDDLRTRALPLYLVRPISASDYVIGKALVLPAILAWVCLLPGLLYYLLVGMWRPPGETGAFLRDNLDIIHTIVQQYLIAAGSYTGLMLFLSARTPRRGAVMGIAAAFFFLGSMVALASTHMPAAVATFARYLGIPASYEAGFIAATMKATAQDSLEAQNRLAERLTRLPNPDIALWVALGILLLGLISVWRRARTVEITS